MDIIQIDLMGEAGNAYAIMAVVSRLCKQLGIDRTPIIEEMTSGNYVHLLDTAEKHLGEHIEWLNKTEALEGVDY